jgi:transcription elongation factor Elf1
LAVNLLENGLIVSKMAPSTTSLKALKIPAQGDIPLSKDQKEFNRLTTRIENLRKEIESQRTKSDQLAAAFEATLRPFINAYYRSRLNLAIAFDQVADRHKFSKRQRKDIGITICGLCDEVFQMLEPTEAEIALFDKWSDTSFEEEVAAQQQSEKAMFEAMMKGMFGLDIDVDDLDDPEKRKEIEKQIEAKSGGEESDSGWGSKRGRRPSANEKAKNARIEKKKTEEELKNKSIRSVYISLAKLLHPDTETEETARAEKEELMKTLSSAYERNDLATLLKMEFEWIHKQATHLSAIANEQLTRYVSVLKDQVRELETELWEASYDPRYNHLQAYSGYASDYGLRKMKTEAKKLKTSTNELTAFGKAVYGQDAQKMVIEFATEYAEQKSWSEGDWW